MTGVRVISVSEAPLTFRQATLRDSVPIFLNSIGVAIGSRTVLAGGVPFAQEVLTLPFLLIVLASSAWGIAEIVTMLGNTKRRAIHDFIAGSIVVRTR